MFQLDAQMYSAVHSGCLVQGTFATVVKGRPGQRRAFVCQLVMKRNVSLSLHRQFRLSTEGSTA